MKTTSITPTRKKLTGKVVSDKMDKTVVVNVQRYVAHKKYGKFYKIDKRYKAHDENNEYHVGDMVIIEESRPLSKDKNFVVIGKKI
ncbi:MAG: 30S ribosomal protein S17 [Candidatus Pacebacteria bacterium]|jgi:small subunit ribosomal protein S17|nr:30S ribosomal protein S17 [Candidatus Paceibacterota bacterium]